LLAVVWIARSEKVFKDFNLRLPSSTEWVMAVSRWMLSYWYVVIFPVGLLFAGNVLILYLLRSRPGSRRLGLHWCARPEIDIARPEIDIARGRKFWSFQPPRRVPPPPVKDAAWPPDTWR
jgi:hypothetical protein